MYYATFPKLRDMKDFDNEAQAIAQVDTWNRSVPGSYRDPEGNWQHPGGFAHLAYVMTQDEYDDMEWE